MADLVMDLGLTSDDLSQAIEEVLADRAAKINSDGLAAQVEFLHSDYCDGNSNTMRAFLNQLVKERQSD